MFVVSIQQRMLARRIANSGTCCKADMDDENIMDVHPYKAVKKD